MSKTTGALVAAVAGAVAAGLMTAPSVAASPAPAQAAPAVARAAAAPAPKAAPARKAPPATTSPLERRRVDRVPTPKLRWYSCGEGAQCATVRLPLDYDQPKGATTEVALARVKAADPKRRLGTLFVNPGGPGGSAVELALAAPDFVSDDVLARFDIVGVDPRGVGNSDPVRCFKSTLERNAKLAAFDALPFPYGAAEEKAYVASAKALGRACSTTGRPLTGAMSTSEDARDLDVLRRAVGDKKLTYLGFSYGTALGQYYANLFPDRVRAIVVDGVINPVTWAGTTRTRETIQDDRLRSADGAYAALREILRRCDAAGGAKCAFAAGNPLTNFEVLARRLRAAPVVLDSDGGQTVTYAQFIGFVLGSLYSPYGYRDIVNVAQQLLVASEPAGGSTTAAARAAAGRQAAAILAKGRVAAPSRDFPYDNFAEVYSTVACTDGQHPADASLWPAKLAASDRRAPYFGRAWGYSTIACGRSTWTIRDEDAYTGPWTKRTSGPVLVVGNRWDPATNYTEAVAVSKLLPNSRLLSSDSWGHTAYGTSACVTRSIDRFVLTTALPSVKGCVGDVQPFVGEPSSARARTSAAPKTTPPLPNPWLAAATAARG
jgi:pimeloyl-ACP methyl ester carboxylesterase